MRIAILGAGLVGQALGSAWTRLGHSVVFGVPYPSQPKYERVAGRIGTVPEAVAGADAIVLAVPWHAAQEALKAAGDLSGRVLIDCTNPLTKGEEGYGLMAAALSGGERVANWASGARVCKTLNQTSWENMADATGYPAQPAMFVACDDPAAKRLTMELVSCLGFEPIDAGALRMARFLEPLAVLWLELATHRGLGRGIAFGLLRQSG